MFKLHACLLTALLWLGVAAGQAPPPSPAPLPSKTEALKRFTAVQLCAPINTLVQPSNGTRDTYTITVQAEQPVLDALTWGVAGGLLSLQAGVFSTSRPIKVVVTMPATALEAISHYGTGAELLVAPGFNVGELNVTTAFGAGRLYVDGLRARTVRADLAGCAAGRVDVWLGPAARFQRRRESMQRPLALGGPPRRLLWLPPRRFWGANAPDPRLCLRTLLPQRGCHRAVWQPGQRECLLLQHRRAVRGRRQ
jgi:hypothetical protein